MPSAKKAGEKVDDLYKQVKDSAYDLMEEGKHKLHEAEDSIKSVSEMLMEEVRERPLRSLLIAGGIGYLLAALLRKK